MSRAIGSCQGWGTSSWRQGAGGRILPTTDRMALLQSRVWPWWWWSPGETPALGSPCSPRQPSPCGLLLTCDVTSGAHLQGPRGCLWGSLLQHLWSRELDPKEDWELKNWWCWTVVLEKTLENPLDNKKIKPINPKGNQSWIFIGRTDAEAETPTLWPSDAKNWLIGKDPDAGKDWRQEEKGMTEDETVGWHHQLNGHEFEQAPGAGEGQGSLACCSPWDRQESDTTEGLNNSNKCNC